MEKEFIPLEDECINFFNFIVKQRAKSVVENINLLLCLTDDGTDYDEYKAAELKNVVERFGIQDKCHIMVTDDYKMRLFFTGYEEEECNE